MAENYQNNQQLEEEEPIDWAKYVAALYSNWKKIAIVTFFAGILGIIVALCQDREYRVSVTLAPESSGGSSRSSLSSIAGMFGVNIGGGSSSPDAMNITLFPDIAASTPFLTSLFEVELSEMPKLPNDNPAEARRIMESPLPKFKLYDYMTGRNDVEESWWDKLKKSIFGDDDEEEDLEYLRVDNSKLTFEQFKVVGWLKGMINVDVDKKTAMTTVSVSMDDPLMCTQLADTVSRRLQEFVFNYRTEKERMNFAYYEAMCDSTYKTMVEAQAAYAASLDNNQSVILQKVSMRSQRLEQEASVASQVYQQMVQQREMSRAQLQEVKPVFAVVEPATMPMFPVNSRKKTCIIVTFFGFALACAWFAIGKEYYEKTLEELKTKLNQEKNAENKA